MNQYAKNTDVVDTIDTAIETLENIAIELDKRTTIRDESPSDKIFPITKKQSAPKQIKTLLSCWVLLWEAREEYESLARTYDDQTNVLMSNFNSRLRYGWTRTEGYDSTDYNLGATSFPSCDAQLLARHHKQGKQLLSAFKKLEQYTKIVRGKTELITRMSTELKKLKLLTIGCREALSVLKMLVAERNGDTTKCDENYIFGIARRFNDFDQRIEPIKRAVVLNGPPVRRGKASSVSYGNDCYSEIWRRQPSKDDSLSNRKFLAIIYAQKSKLYRTDSIIGRGNITRDHLVEAGASKEAHRATAKYLVANYGEPSVQTVPMGKPELWKEIDEVNVLKFPAVWGTGGCHDSIIKNACYVIAYPQIENVQSRYNERIDYYYHPSTDESEASIEHAIRTRISSYRQRQERLENDARSDEERRIAKRKERSELLKKLRNTAWLALDDSHKVGNCVAGTRAFMRSIEIYREAKTTYDGPAIAVAWYRHGYTQQSMFAPVVNRAYEQSLITQESISGSSREPTWIG